MSDQPPVEAPDPGSQRAESLVLVATGDGKGKSTAAFGTMLRAVAREWPVAVVQFLKSGDWQVGEEKIARQLGVEWWAIGDGFTWDADSLDESAAVAGEAWAAASALIAGGDHRLIILDEITYAMNWGWIDPTAVIRALEDRPAHVSVMLTGRDASDALIDAADTVTEMRKVKHAFDAGVRAKRGIDY